MKYLCFFESGTPTPTPTAGVSVVSRDRIVRRVGAFTFAPETGAVPMPDPPPVPYASVVGITYPAGDGPSSAELRAQLGADVVCRVDTRTQFDSPVPSGYVKVIGFLRRRDDRTRDEFATHWNGVHGDLVLASAPTFLRYVTNVAREVAGDFRWDGIVEQWFRSAETLAAHVAPGRPGREAIAADEPGMITANDVFLAEPI